MIRTFLGFLIGLILLGQASGVQAQYRAGRMWAFSSGVLFPVGPNTFSDRWKSGANLGGGIHYCLEEEQRVSLRATAEYSRLSPQKNEVLDELGIVDPGARLHVLDGSGSIWDLTVNLKISPRWTEGRVVPYLIGGAGLMRVSQDVTFTRIGNTEPERVDQSGTDLGWSLGAGLDAKLARELTVFIEGQYKIVFSDDPGPRYLPIRIGVLF